MAPKQRMRIANEKASKNITMRGVPKSSVSTFIIMIYLKGLTYVAVCNCFVRLVI